MQKSGSVRDLCEALSRLNGKDPDLMVAADVYNNRYVLFYVIIRLVLSMLVILNSL